MTFNEKLDLFMKENGYLKQNGTFNIKQLATDSDIPYTTLKDFYDKKSADNSRLSTIRKLSRFMNCSMDYLTYDELESTNDFINDRINYSINDDKKTNQKQILFDKSKDILSDDDWATIEFIMNKTINNYEKSKKNE